MREEVGLGWQAIGGKFISCRKFKSIQAVDFHQESQQIHPEESSEGGFGLSRCLTGSLTSFHGYDGTRFSIIIIPCILVEWKTLCRESSVGLICGGVGGVET